MSVNKADPKLQSLSSKTRRGEGDGKPNQEEGGDGLVGPATALEEVTDDETGAEEGDEDGDGDHDRGGGRGRRDVGGGEGEQGRGGHGGGSAIGVMRGESWSVAMGLAFAEMDEKDTAKREGMAGRECDIYLPFVSFERPFVFMAYGPLHQK